MIEFLIQAVIYLGAAVIVVPIAKRLRLGTIVGYLLAGILVSPLLDIAAIPHSARQQAVDIGIIAMLFLIGLDMNPRRIRKLGTRRILLGVSLAALSVVSFMLISLYAGLAWREAIAIGLILSCSSSTIAIQTLKERGMGRTRVAAHVEAILLVQDVAVIFMLGLMPMLAIAHSHESMIAANSASLVSGLSVELYAFVLFCAISCTLLSGYFIVPTIYSWIARTGLREMLTAMVLLLVIAVSVLMYAVGLPPALGAFLAGVVLALGQFRSQAKHDLAPFKGLFLGVFLLTMGSSIDIDLVGREVQLVIFAALCVLLVKFLLGWLVQVLLFTQNHTISLSCAILLAQAGEFSIVLTAFSLEHQIINAEAGSIILSACVLSLVLTPLLVLIYEWLISPLLIRYWQGAKIRKRESDTVIVAGFGRTGQIVVRAMRFAGYEPLILESDAALVDSARQMGFRAYYGDATRPNMLRAAGVASVRAVVVAIDDTASINHICEHVKRTFPKVTLIARAIDLSHALSLTKSGVEHIHMETYECSLRMARDALKHMSDQRYKEVIRDFAVIDRELRGQLVAATDDEDVFDEHVNIRGFERLIELENERVK